MFDWGGFTLFLYIMMRMSGFVLFSPIFGRNGIPGMFQAGFIGLLSMTVYFLYDGAAEMPDTLFVFAFRLVLELGMGLAVAMVMRFFFFVAEQGGEIVDTQMGMSMARNYDPATQSNATVTANLLNIMMMLLFFTANGHITLLRMLLTSGELLPFGAGRLNVTGLAERGVALFAECALLAMKLGFPILGAEFLGQFGMGVLMKVIPQINVFSINIELKVIIGLLLLLVLLSPISEYLVEIEATMLRELRQFVALAAG